MMLVRETLSPYYHSVRLHLVIVCTPDIQSISWQKSICLVTTSILHPPIALVPAQCVLSAPEMIGTQLINHPGTQIRIST